jgi:hypothetical protein
MIKKFAASRSVSQLLAIGAAVASILLWYDGFGGHDRLSVTEKSIVLTVFAVVAIAQAVLHVYRVRAETKSSD